MRAAVHVDGPEGVRAADVEDVDALQLGQLDELDAVRRLELTDDARRLAARVRLEAMAFAILVERRGPRLKRNVRRDRRRHDAARGQPQTLVAGEWPRRDARGRRPCAAPVRAGPPPRRPRPASLTTAGRPGGLGHADLHAVRVLPSGAAPRWPAAMEPIAQQRRRASAGSATRVVRSVSQRAGAHCRAERSVL